VNAKSIANILFTDEGFTRDGTEDFHNTRIWMEDNAQNHRGIKMSTVIFHQYLAGHFRLSTKPGICDRVWSSVGRTAESFVEIYGIHTEHLLWYYSNIAMSEAGSGPSTYVD
jgi:uncharacterized protein YozE (UPF0346 family)